MNKDTVSGKFDQATGKIKEKTGDLLGNQKLANQGVADQIKGMAKETYGNVKDAGKAAADHAHAHSNANAREANAYADQKNEGLRNKVKNAAQNVKDSISGKADEVKHDQHEKAAYDRNRA